MCSYELRTVFGEFSKIFGNLRKIAKISLIDIVAGLYYMSACGYEFYLLVFNSISSISIYRVEHSKIKFVSTRGHVISSM